LALSGAVLQTRKLTMEFRGLRALSEVDLTIAEGTVHALVGPHGAGKTTLLNLMTGFLAPASGQIIFRGEDITGRPPEQIARLGIARSFEITGLFAQMTAVDQVELALASSAGIGYRFWRSGAQPQRFRDRAMELLRDVGLTDRAGAAAGSLAGGQKRALELALALALDPQLLLLDEPSAGMGPEDVDRTIELVQQVAQGRTVVFADHHMHVVRSLADTVTVLQDGEVLAEGGYDEVRHDDRVVTAYLGHGG
jgi:branched-chain amino acid transport system ATP-binding protein